MLNRQRKVSLFFVICLSLVLTFGMGLVIAQISQSHVISGGLELSYDFTVWYDGVSTYYAKNGYGVLISDTDATVVIQYAIDNGVSVYICPAVYELSQLVPVAGVEVFGSRSGTVLKQADGSDVVFIYSDDDVSGFSLHDLTVDYNHGAQTMGFYVGMQLAQESEHVSLYNLDMINCRGFAVQLGAEGDPPLPMWDCLVENIDVYDIVADHNDMVVVVSNRGAVRNVRVIGVTQWAGIHLFECHNLIAQNNYVYIDAPEGAVTGGIQLGSLTNSIVCDNVVIGEDASPAYDTVGIRIDTEHDLSNSTDSYGNVVSGNQIYLVEHGIVAEESMNDTITSNYIFGTTNGVVFPDWGNPAVEGVIVRNNIFVEVTSPLVDAIGVVDYVIEYNVPTIP